MVRGTRRRHHEKDEPRMRNRNTTDAAEPLTVTIPTATARTGLSRSSLYRLAGARQIKMVKSGRTTLIDWASLKSRQGNLPTAEISPQP
jgi:hypothetical protein